MHLREYLEINNLSTREFARRLGISSTIVQQIAYHNKSMRKETALKIEAFTRGKVSFLELMLPKTITKPIPSRGRKKTK